MRSTNVRAFLYATIFVLMAHHFIPFRRVFAAIKQLAAHFRNAEDRNIPRAAAKLLAQALYKTCLGITRTIFSCISRAISSLFHFIAALHPRIAMNFEYISNTFLQRPCAKCAAAAAAAGAPAQQRKRSFADPAVVEKNMRITRLELELQELRALTVYNSWERAVEEHRMPGEIKALERANARQAALLHEARRFQQRVGLTGDASALIRDLRAQRDGALEDGRRREEELLGEMRGLREEVRALKDEGNLRREKDQLCNAYKNEVSKWKYVARESVGVMKTAQRRAGELEALMKKKANGPHQVGEAAQTNGPPDKGEDRRGQGHSRDQKQGDDHGDDNLARDPLPGKKSKPFWMRLTHADGTPVGMPGIDPQPNAKSQDDDGWATVSTSTSSSTSTSGSDDEDEEGDSPPGIPSSRIGRASGPSSSKKGPGLSTSSRQTPLRNRRNEDATPQSGRGGIARGSQDRRSGVGGFPSSRR